MRYLYAPVETLEASPDAQFFPGLPPAGTQGVGAAGFSITVS